MESFELLRTVHDVCYRLGIHYLTVGSMATIVFGEPRFTLDIDVVLDIQPVHVDGFCSAFPPPDYYLSKVALQEAMSRRSQFNIVHLPSGLKVDCIVPDNTAHVQSELRRGRLVPTPAGFEAMFASPEDVIVKKMEYFRLGESDKHLSDCAKVLVVSGNAIDYGYIDHWAALLQLDEIWKTIQDRVSSTEGPDATPVS